MNRLNSNCQFDSQSVEIILSFVIRGAHAGAASAPTKPLHRIDFAEQACPWRQAPGSNSSNSRAEDSRRHLGTECDRPCCQQAWSACQMADQEFEQALVFELLPDGNCVLS